MTSSGSSISARIRHAREQARLEPRALREALSEKGFDLSKTGLHRLETIEPTNPSVKLIQAIAEITNVSPGWLLFGTGTALKADAAAHAIRGRVLDTIELMSQALDMTSRQPVSYTHLRAHETRGNLVCRLLLEKKLYYGCEKFGFVCTKKLVS